MKKIVLAIILLLGANCILAVSFAPDISLQNIPRIEDNNIDLYKIKNPLIKGLTKSYFAQDFKVTVTKELEYDDNRIKLTFKYKNIEEIYPPVYIPFEQYVSNMFTSKFKEKKDEIRIAKLQEEGRDSGTGLIKDIVIKLPKMAVPKVFRKLMGNQAAKLSLDGSQRLTIGGDKTTRINMGDNEKTGSKFPQFAMRQELNLRLKGTIGKKIHISVDHQSGSENDIVQPTEVNISYRGDDDEIVKTIEGGNIALALSGSHYINYSVSSEGLFGVKSDMEIGNLKLTAIMGKDQAKKNKQKITGGSEQDSTKVESKNYVQRTQYFIEDPAVIYELYSSEDPDAGSVPPGWLDNAIRTDGYGRWILSQIGADLLPKEGTELFLYLDDQNPDNNSTAVPGYGIGESSHPDSASYQFDILREPEDFYINNAGIISLNRSIDKSYIIGITYTRNDGMEVGNASPEIPGDPIEVKIIKQRNQTSDAFPEIWKMQVKNIYNLSPNIQNEGFDIKIFKEFNGVPNYNLPTNVDVTNPDPFGEEFKTFNDYLRLNTNGDDLINNDDETIDLVYGNIIFPFLEPFASFGVVVGDEDIYTGSTPDVTDIFLYVKGKVGRDKIPLQGMDILPGSVKVKINGAAAKENVDYIVDYDMGELVLLSPIAKDPNADIDIDFQSRPLFGIESKTLLGARADLTFNEHAKLGGTIIYQSEKVSEERPKIGSENRSILMADIDGEVGTELPFITTAIDFLPLINTDEPSSVSLSGEVAMSLPRIWGNPKQSDVKEAYIDDMESIVNTYPLGVTRTSWVPASRPLDTDFGKATPNWYNPQNIYGRDVYDPETLTAKEQREKVTLLECRLTPPTITNPHIENKYWGGLMKYVGNQVDFSKKKYIEVLVKVDEVTEDGETYTPEVVMYMDLGDNINEDFYTDFGGQGVLNKEEEHNGVFYHNEDTSTVDGYGDMGLDGIRNGNPGDDPDDDFDFDSGEAIPDYTKINGTEKNHKRDTEDLNDDGGLNEEDLYFEYSVALNDVTSDYFTSEYKGWRLFRIPLYGEENYKIVSSLSDRDPDLRLISYARIWFDVEEESTIQMVYLDVVGNKWEERLIRDENDEIVNEDQLDDFAESMRVGVIDNQKDMHYEPAPNTVFESADEGAKEQSLFIDYTNLQSGHSGLAEQQFSDVFTQATALLRYDKIRFWYYAEKFESSAENYTEQDTLLIRLGSDSLNYYEIKYPFTANEYSEKMQKSNWKQLEIDMADLAVLKSLEDSVYTKNNYTYRIKGTRPSLSYVEMFWLGMKAKNDFSGRIYFDDIRVADPYEDIGYAARTDFRASFADFSSFDLSLSWETPNFQTSADRRNLPSYREQVRLDMTNKYYLQKFFPAEWGVSLPVTLRRNQNKGVPRFQADSDVPLEALTDEQQKHEISETVIYGANVSFGLNKKPNNRILEYLIKNTSVSANAEQKYSLSPTRADSSLTYSGAHSYTLPIPEEKVSFRLWKDYKLGFFPHQMSNSFTYNVNEPNVWIWQAQSDSLLPYWEKDVSNSGQPSKFLNTSSGVSYKFLSDIALSYDLDTKRDMRSDSRWGTEKDRTQGITLGFTPVYTEKLFSINVNARSNYNDDHKTISAQDNSMIYDGGVTRTIDTHVTLKNKDLLISLADWLEREKDEEQEQDSEQEQDALENETDEQNIDPEDEEAKRETEDKNKMLDEEKRKSEEKAEEEKSQEERNRQQEEDERNREKEERKDQEERNMVLEEERKQEEETSKENDENQSDEEGKDRGQGPEQEGDKDENKEEKDDESTPLTFAKVVRYMARIENISFDYDNDLSSTYMDEDNRPEFLYQLGVPGIVGDDDLESRTTTEKYSGSFSFDILEKLTTSWNASKEFAKRYGNSSNKTTVTTTFPGFSFTLRQFETMIGIENILTSSQLSGNYTISGSKIYPIGNPNNLESEQIGYSFTPLLSWTGNWVHNITSTVSATYNTSTTYRYNPGNQINEQKNSTQSLNSNFSWSFKAPTGFKLPWLGRIRFKNELTTSLGLSIEKTKNLEGIKDNDLDIKVDKLLYSISPSASYKFSNNINGGLTGGYNATKDVSGADIIITNLNIWVEIDF